PIQAAPLGYEEVAGVDDLLDLAERLRIGLADLPRDEPRQRLLVVLHEPADLLDRAAANGGRHLGPALLGLARGAACGPEGGGTAEQRLGHHMGAVGGVRGDEPPAGGVGLGAAADYRSDGAGVSSKRVGHPFIVEMENRRPARALSLSCAAGD